MKRTCILVLIALLWSPEIFSAQDTPAPTIGGFETKGSVTAGYRFTDVKGDRSKFNEMFSLRSGFRIHDLALTSQSENNTRFADFISLSASGLGGEPFSGAQLEISRGRTYDLRINYRQSYYYWDRNDDGFHPTGLHGLTSNHDLATVRRFGSIDWKSDLTDNLRLTAEYNRSERAGDRVTTRTLDYFGAPATYAGYLRANPYVVEGPVDEASNRGAVGLAFSPQDWSFFYRAGYQRYTDNLEIHNVAAGQRSINVDEAATANELLNTARWTEFRRISAPFSELSYHGKLHPRVAIRGGYIYYRHSGPTQTQALFSGLARTVNASTIAPFNATMNTQGRVEEPNHVIDQGFTFTFHERARLHTDYRYSRVTMDNHVEYSSTDGAGNHTGEERVEWREGIQTLDIALEITPATNLLLRPGIRLVKRDIAVLHDDIGDSTASRPSKIASPILSVYYAPSPKLSFRGDLRNTTNGGPYTRITPRTDFSVRWVARYQPTVRFSLENSSIVRNAEYTTTDYQNRVRLNSTVLRYAFTKLNLFGGFTYDSYLSTAAVTFLRGTPPLDATWRDQSISRVWEAGIEATPTSFLEFRLSGNYVRTTGVGEISLEPPVFGPVRWPMAAGTVSFNLPKAGQLSLDLQRTYYIEEIVRDSNYSANILGIRWTVDF